MIICVKINRGVFFSFGLLYMKIFLYHYNQTLGSQHFLDYLMNLHYAGINLNASEKTYLLFAKEKYSQSVMSTIMKFRSKLKSFHELVFDSTIINETELTDLIVIT